MPALKRFSLFGWISLRIAIIALDLTLRKVLIGRAEASEWVEELCFLYLVDSS
jgi:hypothetical protein